MGRILCLLGRHKWRDYEMHSHPVAYCACARCGEPGDMRRILS